MNRPKSSSVRSLYAVRALLRHWLPLFLVVYGVFNLLPFLSPLLMKLGWVGAADTIYTFYGTLCHQMAQRSFFLFGERFMYNIDQLPLTLSGDTRTDTLLLRGFRGDDVFGWKVAWSDRMVSLYGSIWLAGLVYWGLGRARPQKPIALWLFLLSALPLALDGGSHMLSDGLGGLTNGFRYHNVWLAELTFGALPQSFYSGDALGSFNSWMRLLTGLLMAFGAVWFTFPLMDDYARATLPAIEAKIERVSALERQLERQREQLLDRLKRLGEQDV